MSKMTRDFENWAKDEQYHHQSDECGRGMCRPRWRNKIGDESSCLRSVQGTRKVEGGEQGMVRSKVQASSGKRKKYWGCNEM